MATVDEQIHSICENISNNIEKSDADRALLSQNILAQLRNLVEAVMVRLHEDGGAVVFDYSRVKPAKKWIGHQKKDIRFLYQFHELLKISTSHYTVSGDASERLMLKYYEYLYRTRIMLSEKCGMAVLDNLDQFPVNLDSSLSEYYEEIADRIECMDSADYRDEPHKRFYIRKVKPFFVNNRVYYEVTFQKASDYVSKFERNIAFTDIDITEDYAANLNLVKSSIDVLGVSMPILLISDWKVSIREHEFTNFAEIVNVQGESFDKKEYDGLMTYLSQEASNLLDLIDMTDSEYRSLCDRLLTGRPKGLIFCALDKARTIINGEKPGSNVLRYLLLHMNNVVIKSQVGTEPCDMLSNLKLRVGCKPFDDMPLCTSLVKHNPKFFDIARSIGLSNREDELLARRVMINTEQNGILFTPMTDLAEFGDVRGLIETYNGKIYHKHEGRKLEEYKDYIFQTSYEQDTAKIIRELNKLTSSGIEGYERLFEDWLSKTALKIDDKNKQIALRSLFRESQVALIYGAAGTGKSKMISYIADMFQSEKKLFLAHTNPAVENLQTHVTQANSEFRTISKQIAQNGQDSDYDLLVIDECSTVCNSDLVKVIDSTSFSKLVLVGDTHQIESIRFGNWFSLIRECVPKEAIFELKEPYRTKDQSMIQLWTAVRDYDNNVEELIARNGYAKSLNKSLLEQADDDEIILCLNYDGLYGINNINRFLQASNTNKPHVWGTETYKVDDPVLFNETARFKPLIYNNLKGRIVAIKPQPGAIQFDVWVDRKISRVDAYGLKLSVIEDQVIRFTVTEQANSNSDDDGIETVVPFQVAYAVSIHKAQGLEYNSVKVVITTENEDSISHSIFYTAITRAKSKLQIFWTPEVEHKVLGGFSSAINMRDCSLIKARNGL